MNKLSISPEARKDLEEIKAYITDELENLVAAVNVVSRITKSLRKLTDMPGIGTPLSSKLSFEIDADYRFLVCGNYLAFYRYTNKTVYIERILYGRRDYAKILFPEIQNPDSKEQ